MKNIIKKRFLKKSSRGIYIQDKELLNTNFKVGNYFNWIVDIKNNKLIVNPTKNTTKNKISKRSMKSGVKPVLDIRNKKALSIFENCSKVELTILEDKVILTGIAESSQNDKKLSILKNSVSNLIKFQKSSFIKKKNTINLVLSKQDIDKAVGMDIAYSIDNIVNIHSNLSKTSDAYFASQFKTALKVVSLFSGAGILDKAFTDEGFQFCYGIDVDENACKTYAHNIGKHIVCENINNVDFSKLPKAPIIIGGPLCTQLSCANRVNKASYIDREGNQLIFKFIDAVKANESCKVFMLENVPQLLTVQNGIFINEIIKRLKGTGFKLTYGVLNAADYGTPQMRKRAIIIGSKIGKIELPSPIIKKDNYKTVGEAFKDLNDDISNQKDYSISRPSTIEKMKQIPIGQNLKSVMNVSKNRHSNVYKRLDPSKPAISIPNPRKSSIIHPFLNRILSVRECARLLGLPDNFKFLGPLSSKQQQVANGVGYPMARAIAKTILNAFYKVTPIW